MKKNTIKKLSILVCFLCFLTFVQAESMPLSFPFYDGSQEYLSMRQMNSLYTSAYSIFTQSLYNAFDGSSFLKVPVAFSINTFTTALIFIPLTHEEAHRSILTSQNIGSISQPIFNAKGSAYVKGVKDETLKNLRDTNLPLYIRLHTAGLESDYTLFQKDLKLMALDLDLGNNAAADQEDEVMRTLFAEYALRLSTSWLYMASGVFDWVNVNLFKTNPSGITFTEEANELDRDIVGHDVYGMIHHLFQPEADFQRYINYSKLTEEEKSFAHRIGLRSFINFASVIMANRYNFKLPNDMLLSGAMGYCIAPFGDFIDENIYVRIKDVSLACYARQFQNRYTWFPAFGVELVSYSPLDWIHLSAAGHFWMQPEDLDFNTTTGVPGGAGELEIQFLFPTTKKTNIKSVGISIGALYKTKGFMPEIEQHESHFRVRSGLVVRF